MANRNPIKLLLGQTAIYGLSTIVVRLLNYVLAPFHTRVFENQADFGIISELFAYVAILNVLFMYGMETSFFRFASKADNPIKVFSTAQSSLLITTTFFVSALILFAQPIANALQYPDHSEFVVYFALIIGLDTLVNIPFARLRLKQKPKTYALIKLLNVCVNVGLNFFFYLPVLLNDYSLFSVTGYVYNPSIGVGYVFIANLVASAFTFALFVPSILKARLGFDKVIWKKLLKYGSPLIIVGLAGMINETLDRVLLKNLLGGTLEQNLAQVGIYSAAYKLAIFMTVTVQAFRMGAEPFFFSQAGGKDAKQIYADVLKYFTIVACIIFLGVSLNLGWIIKILGERFRAGVNLVPILLLANLFLGIFYNLSIWYKLTDKTVYATYIAIFGAAITILLNVLLIPEIGYWGSAYTTLICYIAMTIASFIFSKKYYPVPYNVGKIIGYIVSAVALYYGTFYFVGLLELDPVPSHIILNAVLLLYIAFAFAVEKKHLKNLKR